MKDVSCVTFAPYAPSRSRNRRVCVRGRVLPVAVCYDNPVPVCTRHIGRMIRDNMRVLLHSPGMEMLSVSYLDPRYLFC